MNEESVKPENSSVDLFNLKGETKGDSQIDKPYAYHKPSEEGLRAITELRELFSQVDRKIRELCPPSRQQSVALTNNEQTAMWAIKAVVFNDPKSEVEGG